MVRIKSLMLLTVIMIGGPLKAIAEPALCNNGNPYHLKRTFVEVSGKFEQAYEYEGPLGKGFVQSSVDEATAKQFVCQEGGRTRWFADDYRTD